MTPEQNTNYKASSKYSLLLLMQANMVLYLPVLEAYWVAEEMSEQISFSLYPEDDADFSLLQTIRPGLELIVAYSYKVAACEVLQNSFHKQTSEGKFVEHFSLKLKITRSDFTPAVEVGFSSTSSDRLAEMRARRLLLNENPATETTDINAIMREVVLRGQGTLVQVEKSTFPQLFQQFGSNPDRFLEITWINAVAQLKLSACVADVRKLELRLQGTILHVLFVGTRKPQFSHTSPYEMRIEGTCALSSVPVRN
ncbi:MAG TPA: hypothetical protein VK738_19395 [Terriglobales bacterium]|jgi:hypothetical protein|nr:hypothetical protein [Terriglobales bacterium]